MLNRSQVTVLAFFAAVLVALIWIRIAAPGIYLDALPPAAGRSPAVLDGFVAAVVALVCLVSVGVVRRWRWLFWLLVAAFLAGILRVPGSLLEGAGVLPTTAPPWYLALQAAIGVIQFVIGLALVRGYRKAGPWGPF